MLTLVALHDHPDTGADTFVDKLYRRVSGVTQCAGIRERTERQKLGGHCDWYVGNQKDTTKLPNGNSGSEKNT